MKKIFTLIAVLACALGVQAQDTYVVAGGENLMGVNWDGSSADNQMASTDGGATFTLVKTGVKLRAGNYEYKIVKNGSEWIGDAEGNNFKLNIEENGEYKVTFTFTVATSAVETNAEKTGEATFEDQTWTVVGAKALTGASWADDGWEATYVNDMTSTDGVNFTLVKEDLVLESGVDYGFKVVADHAWDESYPGDNATVTVTENGKYTVTFKFNKDTKEVSADAVKTGEAVIGDKVWTIAGSSEAILGTTWDKENTANDMTDMGDGTFQLVKENVALEAGTNYEFKVLANHSWDENYGADGVAGGENCTFSVDADGNYDVTFVWNPDSKELYATADEATGIKGVKNAAANKNTTMYNLQGQRVQAGFRGIVIMNGRKMIVK